MVLGDSGMHPGVGSPGEVAALSPQRVACQHRPIRSAAKSVVPFFPKLFNIMELVRPYRRRAMRDNIKRDPQQRSIGLEQRGQSWTAQGKNDGQ